MVFFVFLLDFRTVPTVWYFLFSILFSTLILNFLVTNDFIIMCAMVREHPFSYLGVGFIIWTEYKIMLSSLNRQLIFFLFLQNLQTPYMEKDGNEAIDFFHQTGNMFFCI